MAKFKVGDTIHKIGEKILRPFKIEGINEDDYYIIEDKGFYLDCECDSLYELVTDETYRHYTKSMLLYSLIQRPNIKLDEKSVSKLLECAEMHSRFSMHDFLEQSILQMRFIQDSNGDMMRKPLDDL